MNQPATVEVRRMVGEDKAMWLPLWADYIKFYRATVPQEISDHTFTRLCDGEDYLGLVAVDGNNNLLGFMHLIFHPSTWSMTGYCYIEDVFVAKPARGQQVPEAMFAAAYHIADERGSTRVYWMTQEFNAPARSLYDTVGKRTSFIVYRQN